MKERNRRIGITLVHTGEGKGKSSSAFGVAFRAAGWGLNVCVHSIYQRHVENRGTKSGTQI